MHRPRWIRAALLVAAALTLGAAPPEEEPRPSAWNRFINGAKHALFDRENPRATDKQTSTKQTSTREKTATRAKASSRDKSAAATLRGQPAERAGSASVQGRYKRTPPRDSLVRPASAVADDNPSSEGESEPSVEPPVEELAEETAETLPPVARSARPQRVAAKPAQTKLPEGKRLSSKSPGRGPQKPRTVSEYMAKERP